MKKKNKILTIISSIFGVFAICGFSLFSLFDYKKETQVRADYNLVGMASYNFNYRFAINSMSDYWLYVDGTVNAYQLYGENGYHYNYVFSSRCKFYNTSTGLYYPVYKYVSDLGSGVASTFVSSISDIYSQEYHDYIPLYNYDDILSISYLSFTTNAIDIFENTQKFSINLSVVGNVNTNLNGRLGFGNVYCDILFPEYIDDIFNETLLGNIDLNIEVSDPYSMGYSEGYNSGSGVGYANGVNDGFSSGYDTGYSDGVNSQQELISNAYSNGYSSGYTDGSSEDDSIATIFSNIFLVAMVPVDFFLRVLNWEILGVNIASFVTALISVAATVIVIRLVTGKKND